MCMNTNVMHIYVDINEFLFILQIIYVVKDNSQLDNAP